MRMKLAAIACVMAMQCIVAGMAAPPAQDVRQLYRLNRYGNAPGGERTETIGLRNEGSADEELVIEGAYTIYYFDAGKGLMVTYTADGNGYVVRTVYGPVPPPPLGVSANALKSAAG